VTGLSWKEDRYQVEFSDRVSLETWLGPTGAEVRAIRHGLAHLMLPDTCKDPEAGLAWLETLL
jgi:hypothetical protein